ncbi:MAG: site-2 protease family protein [Candidatus Thermoplasmatota archaeon]|nr:site-2 protease family protein [Candidatus Thermoplasmatota archaeon]
MAEKKKTYTSFHDIPPREYMYFPKGTIDVSEPGKFSRLELTHLLLSMVVLTVAFSFALTRNNVLYGVLYGFDLGVLVLFLPVAFLGVLTAFIFHELSHKLMAQKYGLWAEYRMYPNGLLMALVFALFTPFVFAAPGAVMFRGETRSYEMGRIALSGPLANVVVAGITLPLYLGVFYESTLLGPIVGFICLINAILAAFNLLPIRPLDGSKVVQWNPTAWIIAFIVAIALVVLAFRYAPVFSF